MPFTQLENQYYFVEQDYRYEDEPEKGHSSYPYIRMGDSQDLNWWSNNLLEISEAIDFHSDEDYTETRADFAKSDILSTSYGPVFQRHARDLIIDLVPKHTQWLPSYIKTSKGKIIEDWWMLHVWKLWDCWDRERSIRKVINGKVKNRLEKIYLNHNQVMSIPENERLIIRLEVFDGELVLFHERIVQILLKNKMKGALFVPLRLYSGLGASWWYNNQEEINRLHPW